MIIVTHVKKTQKKHQFNFFLWDFAKNLPQ